MRAARRHDTCSYVRTAAVCNNAMGDPNRKAVQPSDIVPRMQEKEKAGADITQLTPEQRKQHLLNVFSAFRKR